MDPLSDVLSLLQPRSYITAGLDAGGAWSIRFDDLAGRIKCYAITRGSCWLAVDAIDEPVRLSAGDCFVLASGRPFVLASDLALPSSAPAEVFGDEGGRGGVVVHNGGGDVFLTGSRFAVDGRHADLLLRSLPPLILLDTQADQDSLRWSIERMMAELRNDQPGGAMMAQHLSHMMLLQALRLHLRTSSDQSVSWFAALSEPQVAAAIAAMHADPARRWTLDELAAEAGMSRSIFAQRFRERVGETPIAYLTRWRMMLAGDRLMRTDASLARTARSLGYESENSFNTAFKRVMGVSPRRYSRGAAESAASGVSAKQ